MCHESHQSFECMFMRAQTRYGKWQKHGLAVSGIREPINCYVFFSISLHRLPKAAKTPPVAHPWSLGALNIIRQQQDEQQPDSRRRSDRRDAAFVVDAAASLTDLKRCER